VNRFLTLAAACLVTGANLQAFAATQVLNAPRAKPADTLPDCGSTYSPPFASGAGTTQQRVCAAPVKRSYKPKYHGLGYDVLALESEACFVPDSSFQLLDSIVDQAKASMKAIPPGAGAWEVDAQQKLTAIGDVLKRNGFGLYIPTATLGDALADRNLEDGLVHMMDCDTSSMIYLTVADEVSMPLSMVDITLHSGAGHNYLRWTQPTNTTLDWDTNGRERCRTPSGLPTWQGHAMTRQEVLGYSSALRAAVWARQKEYPRALADYRSAIAGYPAAPMSYNNMAWLIATKAEVADPTVLQEGLSAAQHAVSIERSANYLDTLACMYARVGKFQEAITEESNAASLDPDDAEFQPRLKGFNETPPRNCVGAP